MLSEYDFFPMFLVNFSRITSLRWWERNDEWWLMSDRNLPFGTRCRASSLSCTTFHTWRVCMVVITCTGFGGFERRRRRSMSTFCAARSIWLCCDPLVALQIIMPIVQNIKVTYPDCKQVITTKILLFYQLLLNIEL